MVLRFLYNYSEVMTFIGLLTKRAICNNCSTTLLQPEKVVRYTYWTSLLATLCYHHSCFSDFQFVHRPIQSHEYSNYLVTKLRFVPLKQHCVDHTVIFCSFDINLLHRNTRFSCFNVVFVAFNKNDNGKCGLRISKIVAKILWKLGTNCWKKYSTHFYLSDDDV